MNETKWNGQKISVPGMYSQVGISAYHGDICDGPSVSSGVLRTVWNESLAHAYVNSYMNPDRMSDDKPQFALGRLAHTLLMEGLNGFGDQYAVRPDHWKDWRTKDAQAWREEQIVQGKTVVSDSDIAIVTGMAKSLGANPIIKQGILDGRVERSLFWRDDETGIWCKSRPDTIPTDSGDYADLKTTAAVDDESIQRSIANYGYHMQGAMVAEGSRHVLGIEMESFTLVFVENKPPYSVRIVTIPMEDIDRGAHQNRWAIREFAKAVASGEWAGPGNGSTDAEIMGLPEWSRRRIDEKLAVVGALQEAERYAAGEHLK